MSKLQVVELRKLLQEARRKRSEALASHDDAEVIDIFKIVPVLVSIISRCRSLGKVGRGTLI